jgi:hypothetical protein
MKSKSHFFHDLDLSSIIEPADPNDKNYSATKVGWLGTPRPGLQLHQHQHGNCTSTSRV